MHRRVKFLHSRNRSRSLPIFIAISYESYTCSLYFSLGLMTVVQCSTSVKEVYEHLAAHPGVMERAYSEQDRLHDCGVLANENLGRKPTYMYITDGTSYHKQLDSNYVILASGAMVAVSGNDGKKGSAQSSLTMAMTSG